MLALDRRRAALLPARRARAAARPAARSRAPRGSLGPARRHGRLEHVAAALRDRARARADRPDDVLRRHHCRVQRHLPAAGRGRRPPLERRRRGARRDRRARACRRACAPRWRTSRASPRPSRCSTATPTSAATSRISTASTPRTVVRGAQLQDSWFAGGTASHAARDARAHAERRPAERGGRARLPAAPRRPDHDARCSTSAPAGRFPSASPTSAITKEFPTAPKDAYTIVNAGYVAQATHDPRVSTLLVQTQRLARRRPSGGACARWPGRRRRSATSRRTAP